MLIPFIGTTIGAAFVFFLKKSIGKKIQKALKGIWLQVPMFPGLHLMENTDPGIKITVSWSNNIAAINMYNNQGSNLQPGQRL